MGLTAGPVPARVTGPVKQALLDLVDHAVDAGRSISPNFVEDAIRTGTTSDVVVNGVSRTIHSSGTVQVVTEQGGRIVVTVNPFSGG